MVSKVQLNELQLKKSGLPTWDIERGLHKKRFQGYLEKRCLKCGKFFRTKNSDEFVLCVSCGSVRRQGAIKKVNIKEMLEKEKKEIYDKKLNCRYH